MYEGRYAEARSQARIGLAVDGGGADSLNFRNFKAAAERAIARSAAPGTVRLTVQPNASDSAAHARNDVARGSARCAAGDRRTPLARRASAAGAVPQPAGHRPAARALAAMVITWSAWGSLNPLPTVGDEAAYVLQAKLLARGHIAGDAPPIPEFFEQAHVLVTPRLAPKYPLGFGLALVPGVLLGATALVPLLLTGLIAALLFVLCRRLYGARPHCSPSPSASRHREAATAPGSSPRH